LQIVDCRMQNAGNSGARPEVEPAWRPGIGRMVVPVLSLFILQSAICILQWLHSASIQFFPLARYTLSGTLSAIAPTISSRIHPFSSSSRNAGVSKISSS